MPLDPQARALLDQLAAQGAPPLSTLSPQQARARLEAETLLLGPPPDVARVEDFTLPGSAGAIPVRVYTPTSPGPHPALVFFHGGGWVIGSIATHDAHCRELANAAPAVVVSVEYRLAPEHRFPAAPEDCFAATAWVAAHARELGADPTRVAVGGDSAGANLAAVVALMARDRGGPSLALQVLIYPITDCDLDTPSYWDYAEGYLLTRRAMAWFWDHYVAEPEQRCHPYVSPLRAPDLSGLPPALVITAEYDPLRDEGEAYAHRLRQAGVAVRATRYEGQIHGFMRRRTGSTESAVAEVAEAVHQATLRRPQSIMSLGVGPAR